MTEPELAHLNALHRDSGPEAILAAAVSLFEPGLTFACSLGLEDMVLVDLISRLEHPPEIFFLDTGRLPQETYDTLEAVRDRYGLAVRVYCPQAAAVEAMVSAKGPNAFYRSLEDRHACCHIRKVEPLGRALAGKTAWITGLRRDQALTRAGLLPFEADPANGLVKVSPLAAWTLDQVQDYIRIHEVPHNPLHARGYPTLGCAPCTRAVAPGEDVRAGRWWWERPEHKECGLHQRPSTQETP
jgi:phosphoadenosine phosphosulfate reductase